MPLHAIFLPSVMFTSYHVTTLLLCSSDQLSRRQRVLVAYKIVLLSGKLIMYTIELNDPVSLH